MVAVAPAGGVCADIGGCRGVVPLSRAPVPATQASLHLGLSSHAGVGRCRLPAGRRLRESRAVARRSPRVAEGAMRTLGRHATTRARRPARSRPDRRAAGLFNCAGRAGSHPQGMGGARCRTRGRMSAARRWLCRWRLRFGRSLMTRSGNLERRRSCWRLDRATCCFVCRGIGPGHYNRPCPWGRASDDPRLFPLSGLGIELPAAARHALARGASIAARRSMIVMATLVSMSASPAAIAAC